MGGTPFIKLIKADNADDDSTWTASPATATKDTDVDIFIEGQASIIASTRNVTRHYYFTLPGATNFTNLHAGGWVQCSAGVFLETFALGGIRLYLGDGSNWSAWTVAGRDTYLGGWQFYLIDTNTSPSFDSGTPANLAAITQIGWTFVVGGAKNVDNTWIDAIYYGEPISVIYGGTEADPATFETLVSASEATNNAWGLLSETAGLYVTKGAIQVGQTGSATTYFKDTGKIISFEDVPVSESLYAIEITGSNTTASFGDSVGDASDGVTYGGILFTSETGSLRYDFRIAPEVRKTSLLSSTFNNAKKVYLGDSGSADQALTGSTLEIVNTSFSDTYEITKNIFGEPTLLGSKFAFTTTSFGEPSHSMNLIDTGSIDGNGLAAVGTYGFKSEDNSVSQSFEVINMSWDSNNKFITIYDNKIWNVINPTWTVTTESVDLLYFAGTNSTSSRVVERYSANYSTQTPTGDAIQSSSLFYTYRTSGSDSVFDIDNAMYTDVTGEASASILVNTYTSASETLDVVSRQDFSLKAYRYAKSPFVSAVSVIAPIDNTITLVPDANISEPDQDVALSYSESFTLEETTGSAPGNQAPNLLIEFDGGIGTLTSASSQIGVSGIGDTTGSFIEYASGDATAGKIFLRSNTIAMTEIISGSKLFEISGDWEATASAKPLVFSWEIDCGNEAIQTYYNYLFAEINTNPLTSVRQDVVVWGGATYAALVQVGPDGYYTERNDGRHTGTYRGVYISRKGAGTVEYFTDDSGSQFVPPTTVTHTLTGLVSGSEVTYVTASAANTELYHLESAPVSGITEYTYTYQFDRVCNIYINEPTYEWKGILNITLGNTDASIPVEQILDPNYYNPS